MRRLSIRRKGDGGAGLATKRHPPPSRKSTAETIDDDVSRDIGDSEHENGSVSVVSTCTATSDEEGAVLPPAEGDSSVDDDPWSDEEVRRIADLWELTQSGRGRLGELGDRLRDVRHHFNTPNKAVRYLLAKNHNVDAAESMFRDMIRWRRDSGADSFLDEHVLHSDFVDHYPCGILEARDRHGDPIFLSRTGATDGAGFLERHGRDEMIKFSIYMRESILRWIDEEYGRPFRQLVIVEDLDGLCRRKHMSGQLLLTFGEIMRLDQDNYAESAKVIILIRTPSIFRIVWGLTKHFFDARVRDKMIFCGPHNYQEVLRQYLGDDLESILPDTIVPNGRGRAVECMRDSFLGGDLAQIHAEGEEQQRCEPRFGEGVDAVSALTEVQLQSRTGRLVSSRTLMVGCFDHITTL